MKKLAGAVNCRYLLSLLLSILFAFLIGAGILAVSGFHPLEAYGAMLSGAFDSARHIGDFLEYAMVLCVCGLACVLGARVGIFNVGGEGQLLLGAIFAAQVGVWMDGQPRFLVIVCAALAAMAVGGLYAFLPGVLKVKVKVNEVITTIMLNTIAAYLCQYLAKGPWKNANKNMVAATEQLGAQYWFGNVIPRSNLTSAVFAAAVMAFLVWYVMERTSVGYEMRITGENPRFAFFSGLRTDRIVLLSMVVSGAMCGLVGMFRVYGVEHLYRDSVSKDYYFEALMVAMIAQYKPVTVILLSLFFAVLKIGAQGMELIGIPSQIYLIIQTVIIFCIAAGRNAGSIMKDISIPMNTAFNTAPITIDTGSPAVLPNFFLSRPTATASRMFPIIIQGNIAGIAAIIGLPVMKNDVIGVMMLKMIPHAIPAYTTVSMRAALMIGPVI